MNYRTNVNNIFTLSSVHYTNLFQVLDYQGEKFKLFLERKGISKIKAASMLGISRTAVYNYFETKSLERDTVNNILTVFKVSEEEIWGNGKKYSKAEDDNITYFEEEQKKPVLRNPRLEADPLFLSPHSEDIVKGEKFIELPDGSLAMNVRIVPYKAQAGYLLGFQDPEYFEDMEIIPITVLKRHQGHYLAFEVKGDSMTTLEPEHFRKSIFDGQIAIGRDLAKHHWRSKLHIHSNDAWVIVHRTEGILIKQIIAHDVEKATITIHSLNPSKAIYPDETLSLSDVEQIFAVVQVVDRKR